MNKMQIKKLFWKISNEIEGVSDTIIKNDKGVVTERGMQLSNGYSAMFGLDTGVLNIYNKEHISLMHFTEDSEALFIIKELFESLES